MRNRMKVRFITGFEMPTHLNSREFKMSSLVNIELLGFHLLTVSWSRMVGHGQSFTVIVMGFLLCFMLLADQEGE